MEERQPELENGWLDREYDPEDELIWTKEVEETYKNLFKKQSQVG